MRGLKHNESNLRSTALFSHPSRMRGLKLTNWHHHLIAYDSHPSRMRGLKHRLEWQLVMTVIRIHHGCVDWNKAGGYTGNMGVIRIHHGCVDWNECLCLLRRTLPFASITDAWIETLVILVVLVPTLVRIHHGCVDWNFRLPVIVRDLNFASITDAWIETL